MQGFGTSEYQAHLMVDGQAGRIGSSLGFVTEKRASVREWSSSGLLAHGDVDFRSVAPCRLVRCTKLKHLFIPQLFRSHPPTANLVL